MEKVIDEIKHVMAINNQIFREENDYSVTYDIRNGCYVASSNMSQLHNISILPIIKIKDIFSQIEYIKFLKNGIDYRWRGSC